MRHLVAGYRDYAATLDEAQIVDFCYNLTLGRSHYNYRFAFAAKSRDDMLAKLEQVLKSEELNIGEGYYLGQYSIVSESKPSRYPHEITINEQLNLTNECDNILKADYNKDWDKLMALYVKGAEVKWFNIYSGSYNKMHLPVYVFEKNNCWYSIPENDHQPDQLDSYFHAKTWVRLDNDKSLDIKDDAYTLIIYDSTNYDSKFTEAVEAKCRNVISVITYDEGEYIADGSMIRMPANEGCYQRLFEELSGKRVEHIIHRRSIINEQVKDVDRIYDSLERGFLT